MCVFQWLSPSIVFPEMSCYSSRFVDGSEPPQHGTNRASIFRQHPYAERRCGPTKGSCIRLNSMQ